MRRTARTMIMLGAAGSALTLSACDNATESGIEQLVESQGGGDVDLDLDGDGGFSMQTEEGGMTIDEDGNFVITDADGSVVTGSADAESGEFTVESEDGSFTSGTGSELPDGWPETVPAPDGLAIASSTAISDGGTEGFLVIGQAESSFLDEYASALDVAGFELESEFTADSIVQRTYTDGTWGINVGTAVDGEYLQATVTVFSAE